MELAALTGSAKQIDWATSERAKVIAEIERFRAIDFKELEAPRPSYESSEKSEKARARISASIALYDQALATAATLTSARVWIELLRTQGAERCVKILTTAEGKTTLARY